MAKTNTKVLAEQAIAEQKAWDEFKGSYPQRFAALMYEVMTLGQETQFEHGTGFSVTKLSPNEYLFSAEVSCPAEAKLQATLPDCYQPHYIWDFENIEGVVREYHERKAEEARKFELRRGALEKIKAALTPEERALLGY